MVGKLQGRAVFHSDLGKLEELANLNLMKLKGKCKLLHQEQSNSMKQDGLGAD